jgi:3-methylcrotonyl-CoA carboxylase alpha subunit
LSENADFSEKCKSAGITFIGPPSNAIRKMGMKNEAKKIMIAANVPTIQGYNDENQDPGYLFEQAKIIGWLCY